MLQHKSKIHHAKTLIISVIAISIAGCSAGTENVNSSTDSPSSPATDLASSPSPQATGSSASITIPGVNDTNEINFKPTSQNPQGFFDGINGSSASTLEVPKAAPLTASGWAVFTNEGKLPDRVLITSGDDNSLVAVAPVNLERPDVVKALKNPAYKNSGWSATFNSSTLPTGTVVLKAWAYNAAQKEATQLGNTHEVVVPK